MRVPRLLAVVACSLVACARREPAPPALAEPAPPASAAEPDPGGMAPSPSADASAPAPPEAAPEAEVDPATVTVPPLDPDARAAIAALVAAQRAIAPEKLVQLDGPTRYGMEVSPGARRLLPGVKRASREAARRIVGAGLAAGERSPAVLAVQVKKALRAGGVVFDERGMKGGCQAFGAIDDVTVERPAGHPSRLALVVELALPCGSDGSFYVLEEQPQGAPRLVMAVEANGYVSISGGQLALTHRLSVPDEKGGWFAVVASASPWCSSAWRGIDYGVYAPGASPDAPQRLLHDHESAWLGDQLCTLEAGRDDLTVRFTSWTRFSDDVMRPHVRRYARRGGAFTRTQPIVAQAIDLPREWAVLPWDEAQRFVAGPTPATLRSWHDRLSGARDEYGARLAVESEDVAAGRTRLSLSCPDCKKLPAKLFFDVLRDGPGWAMEAVTQPP